MLKFITGNKNKFSEVRAILAPIEVEQVNINLEEIQSLDVHEIMEHKLLEAANHMHGEYIVEDTSLYLECLQDKLPGPYIKWFLESLGASGISDMALKLGKKRARGITIFGYRDLQGEVHFFEGINYGEIVAPLGDNDFGWGPIFKPDGHGKTYGEMEREEKYAVSMRGIAGKKLKEFLESNHL